MIDYLKTELEIDKDHFVNKLRASVDQGSTGLFGDPFEAFFFTKNEFKGYVGPDNFKIKRRSKLFDPNVSLAIASGTYKQMDKHLVIEAEINGFTGMMIPFYGFLVVFYSMFLVGFVIGDVGADAETFAVPFMFIHAMFMFGIPYVMMRRSVSRMKHDLEREFFYLTKGH